MRYGSRVIDVKLEDLLPPTLLALLGSEFPSVVADDVAAAARAHWIVLAQRELHTSKRDYINGIQPVAVEAAGVRVIELEGWLPNAVEQGLKGYDLRETILRGPRAKTNAQGQKYAAIPFRHSVPGTKGSAAPAMGSRMGPQHEHSQGIPGVMSKSAAASLGKGIYARARVLESGQRLGTKAGTGYVPVRSGKTRTGVEWVPKLAPHHKTDIYAGMKRETKTYASATQAQYVTFRTISEANPEGWRHPGISARMLSTKVITHIREIAPKIVTAAVQNALKGSSA